MYAELKLLKLCLLAACVSMVACAGPATTTQVQPDAVPTPAVKAPKPPVTEYVEREGYVSNTIVEPTRGYRRGVNTKREKITPGRDFPLVSGTISMTLQRLPMIDDDSVAEYETLFALIDRQGKQVMTAYLVWNPPANYHGDGTPGLNIYSETMATQVWGFWLPFPNDVNVGEVFGLRFEWDKDTTRIFLNETELRDRCPQFSETASCSDKVSGGFPTFLSSVNLIQFGADPFTGDNSPMDTTKLLNYQFREIQ